LTQGADVIPVRKTDDSNVNRRGSAQCDSPSLSEEGRQ
jgi:hypothetical protein